MTSLLAVPAMTAFLAAIARLMPRPAPVDQCNAAPEIDRSISAVWISRAQPAVRTQEIMDWRVHEQHTHPLTLTQPEWGTTRRHAPKGSGSLWTRDRPKSHLYLASVLCQNMAGDERVQRMS